MLVHNYDRSFVAHVACTTPEFEGYLDCAKLSEREGQAARIADDFLVVSSLLGREPHRFWFRCMVDETRGRRYYDIQSWSRRTGRDFNSRKRYLDRDGNGYACLYDTKVSDDRLWKVMTRNDQGQFVSMDQDLHAGDKLAVRIWTRTTNIQLCAMGRMDVLDHWFAYGCAGTGEPLDLEVQITDIGEELLDDH
ncbi:MULTISPECIES: hypothetical protein [Pseudomonas]|uniref:hypothetical protein n=1 Tax=Pseudomonas TaxID=286 RepID=UPI00164569FF|nr:MULTISPECIES: hypothetical protein [Pseudomonas]QXI48740.1 hypothetical protein HU763_004600 [Pseudomonas anuradhapurensis]